MVADGKPVLVLLRGDHQLSETKFGGGRGRCGVSPRASGGDPRRVRRGSGIARPGGRHAAARSWRTTRCAGRRNMIAGANKDDYHLRHVTPGEDFQAEFIDLRQVEAGDACTACGAPVEIRKTVEIGHIFKLGYKYSESMGLHVTNADGRGSDADHGILRHRHRAHPERGDRAVSRQGRHVPAAGHRAVHGGRDAGEHRRRGAEECGRRDLRALPGARVSTRCSTIATSGRA